jgi:hypothetical protein
MHTEISIDMQIVPSVKQQMTNFVSDREPLAHQRVR